MSDFLSGTKFEFTGGDAIHDVAGIFRLWLGSLPEPIIPFQMYNHSFQVQGKKQIISLKKLLSELPPLRFKVLERLCRLLKLISLYSDENKMSAENLSIVMTPNILRAKEMKATTEFLTETQLITSIVTLLIKEYDVLLADHEPNEKEERKKFNAQSVKNHLESKFSKIKLGDNPVKGKKHHEILVITPEDFEVSIDNNIQSNSTDEEIKENENTPVINNEDNIIVSKSVLFEQKNDVNDEKPKCLKPKKSQTRGRSYTNALQWLIAMQEDGKIDDLENEPSVLSLCDNPKTQKKQRQNRSQDID